MPASAQTLVDASSTISQVEDDLLESGCGLAQRRDPGRGAEGGDRAAAEQRAPRAHAAPAAPIDAVESQTQVSNFQDSVFSGAADAFRELQNQLKSLVASDAQRSDLGRRTSCPRRRCSSFRARTISRRSLRKARAESAGGPAGRRQALAADIDEPMRRTSRCRKPTCRCSIKATDSPAFWRPFRASLPSFCQSIHESLPHVRRRRPTRRAQWRGPITTCGPATFPTFNIALIVGYPIQGHVARGLRGLASEETTQAEDPRCRAWRSESAPRRATRCKVISPRSRSSTPLAVAREAAEAVYASEVRKFHKGASTTFLVLQRQVQLDASARQRAASANAAEQSIVELAARRGHDPHDQRRQRARRSEAKRSRGRHA